MGLQNHIFAFTNNAMLEAFRNNIMWLIFGTGFSVGFGLLIAVLADRTNKLANFSEGEHTLPANLLRIHGLGYHFTNLLNDERLSAESITLPPYAFLPLKCEGSSA